MYPFIRCHQEDENEKPAHWLPISWVGNELSSVRKGSSELFPDWRHESDYEYRKEVARCLLVIAPRHLWKPRHSTTRFPFISSCSIFCIVEVIEPCQTYWIVAKALRPSHSQCTKARPARLVQIPLGDSSALRSPCGYHCLLGSNISFVSCPVVRRREFRYSPKAAFTFWDLQDFRASPFWRI